MTGEVVGALIDAFADLTDVVGGRGRGRGWSRSRLGLWPFGSGRARCCLLVTVEESSVREGGGGNSGGGNRGGVVGGGVGSGRVHTRGSAIPSCSRIPGAG